MHPAEVRDRVEKIREQSDYDHIAHRLEDELYMDVLEAIAGGAEEPAALADAALATAQMQFSRWYD
jgi:hypothetical protein